MEEDVVDQQKTTKVLLLQNPRPMTAVVRFRSLRVASVFQAACVFVLILCAYSLTLLLVGGHPRRGHHPEYGPNRYLLSTPEDGSLLNLTSFSYVVNNQNVCRVDRLYFLVFVHSKVDNFRERQAIRDTWGSVKQVDGWEVRLVFMLGIDSQSNYQTWGRGEVLEVTQVVRSAPLDKTTFIPDVDSDVQTRVEQESAIFGDIVQGNFEDSYRNLTYKHLMGYKWVSTYCDSARFAVKADDDVFIDIHQLQRFILRTYGPRPTRSLVCNVHPGTNPRHSGKWRVTKQEYPATSYPSYCGGLAYLVTPDLVRELYQVSHRVPFFWIDDVYVTGLLARVVGVIHYSLNLRYSFDVSEYTSWLSTRESSPRPAPYIVVEVDHRHPNWRNILQSLWNKTTQTERQRQKSS